MANKGGSKDATVTTTSDDKSKDKAKSTGTEISDEQKITANSALSEYLAVTMMGGETIIDLSDFPEAQSEEILVDAWQEATYQNPLILGVDGAKISTDGKTMLISYEDSQADMLKKQGKIKKEVSKVVKDIIKPDMTDLQKEYAINAYLTKIAEYDDAALENAEKNNFKKVDEKFNDSFTPYGVLINKVGVCASYASAFKLLADEAKLDAIVVTGYLDGEVPHLIGDYESAYLDATDDYDYKKAEEDTYNKYREILDKSDLVESSDKLNIMMSKKDGKWDIKMKNVDDSQNEYLLQSYVGDVMDY